MTIIKWKGRECDPFKELLDLQNGTLRLFDSSWDTLPQRLSKEAVWSPCLDVAEDKENITVKADLPGVKQSDIDVSVVGDVLNIRGERKQENEVREKKYHRLERFYGSFTRSLTLPGYADASKVSANYKEGILEIVIPKTERAKPRQIKVDVN